MLLPTFYPYSIGPLFDEPFSYFQFFSLKLLFSPKVIYFGGPLPRRGWKRTRCVWHALKKTYKMPDGSCPSSGPVHDTYGGVVNNSRINSHHERRRRAPDVGFGGAGNIPGSGL